MPQPQNPILTGLTITALVGAAFAFGWYAGQQKGRKEAFAGNIPVDEARKILPKILDASKVPHGDIAVPGNVHSGRYVVSQWQRLAAGAVVVVLGEDDSGELCIAMGPQRGKMRVPQGYMEAPLPKEDLTGLREKGASRVNGTTGELVMSDETLEDTAVREVYEEIGLRIEKNGLELLSISSDPHENPIVYTIAPAYGIKLSSTPPLKTTDTEFASDDISSPRWFKISQIQHRNGNFYVEGSPLPMDKPAIPAIQKAIRKFGTEQQQAACEAFLNAEIGVDGARRR